MSENKKLLLSKAISTKMENRNKDIKKDENGDYPVIVGAVNHFTAGGELYVAEEVKEKFADNSVLMERCKNDLLEIEDEHPTWEPSMSKAQWFERLYSYDKSKVAAKITKLWLEETDECAPGTDLKIILIWASIRPFTDRPKGLLLKRDLENPDPSLFLLACADKTKDGNVKGGTATAWKLAKKFGVPCLNIRGLSKREIFEFLKAILEEWKNDRTN